LGACILLPISQCELFFLLIYKEKSPIRIALNLRITISLP
jgi:hypothetical protein